MMRPHSGFMVTLILAAFAAFSGLIRAAEAQTYPTRPVRLLVGFPAGNSADLVARLMGQWLSERFGQPFVIENRPGAGTNIATETVVHAPADGHTLLLITPPNTINSTLYDKLNFNFMRDIAPVSGIMRSPLVMEVTPSFPARTVPELIAYAKANPGKISIASAGNGTVSHLTVELFKMSAGIDMVRVPYPSTTSALPDLFAGRVQVVVDPIVSSIAHIRADKLRPLAVTTAMRSEALPEVPVMGDFLPGYEASALGGIGAPRNTPPDIVEKLNRAINAGLADPKIKAQLADLGGMLLTGSPDDFGKFLAEETEKWAKVIRFSGVKPN